MTRLAKILSSWNLSGDVWQDTFRSHFISIVSFSLLFLKSDLPMNVLFDYHIGAAIKWPPFHRRHFQMHLLKWKHFSFKQNFTEVWSLVFKWQYESINSDDGLAPNRRQAIMWNNVDMLYWRTYASHELNEFLTCLNLMHVADNHDDILIYLKTMTIIFQRRIAIIDIVKLYLFITHLLHISSSSAELGDLYQCEGKNLNVYEFTL